MHLQSLHRAVQSTVSALRQLGWTEIEIYDIEQRRIDVRRDRVGLHEEGLRGVNASAANVEEAVERLREVESRFAEWHELAKARKEAQKEGKAVEADGSKPQKEETESNGAKQQSAFGESRQGRLEKIKREAENRKIFREGRLVHKTEQEVKSHTSYLVFAVLPREWTEEDEQRCLSRWGTGPVVRQPEKEEPGLSKKQLKKMQRAAPKAVEEPKPEI